MHELGPCMAVIGLWCTWREGTDCKGFKQWGWSMGDCFFVARLSSFTQGKKGPVVVEKGILKYNEKMDTLS